MLDNKIVYELYIRKLNIYLSYRNWIKFYFNDTNYIQIIINPINYKLTFLLIDSLKSINTHINESTYNNFKNMVFTISKSKNGYIFCFDKNQINIITIKNIKFIEISFWLDMDGYWMNTDGYRRIRKDTDACGQIRMDVT